MTECIDCGVSSELTHISHKGLCIDCAAKRVGEVASQMAQREGPYYEKWLLSRQKAVANYRAKMEKAIKNYDASLGILEHLATPMGQAEWIVRFANLEQELL